MNFDVYYSKEVKPGIWVPGTEPVPRPMSEILIISELGAISEKIAAYRNGDNEAKKSLPAICWTGKCNGGSRCLENCLPTQFVMVDVDHVADVSRAVSEIKESLEACPEVMERVLIEHITPSGKGLRFVFYAWPDLTTLEDNMKRFSELLGLDKYGDVDMAVKDVCRLSFMPQREDILFVRDNVDEVYEEWKSKWGEPIKNEYYGSCTDDEGAGKVTKRGKAATGVSEFTAEEIARFESFDYRGVALRPIVEKYVEVNGEPTSGEIHSYYNEMVKNFRCICDNNKRLLLWLLPRFGHTAEECWSQIQSICRVNTLSTLPKPFYYFLKENGFYTSREAAEARNREMKEMDEEERGDDMPPYLPPVFKEFVKIAPRDFVFPMINALLPVMGTLTSYAKAVYPYDNREHTTSFFSVIYAPPGTGKGFVERLMDVLFEDLRLRDYVQSERENVYLRAMNRKSANDKSPDMPHTSLRIIPAKNSEAEFLQKQRDNHGYHMFTYAAEMDSWAKGVRAAGGNKDDMVRVAWDNGLYGQQFKATNTFKGMVRLYWNVLITGTYQQLLSYFKNVENGLVTRCSFTSIDNQEFSEPPVWKSLSQHDCDVIKAFRQRCDFNTYATPCNIVPEDLMEISDEDFDQEVDWQFKFKERTLFDCSWIMPTITRFNKEQVSIAAAGIDKARDVFRRRVAVRGFRLALMCMCLWDSPGKSQLKKCAKFIDWYMHRDIEEMLKLWGQAYNRIEDTATHIVQKNLYNELPDEFTQSELIVTSTKLNVQSTPRLIICRWKKLGLIEKTTEKTYRKIRSTK